jgi:DNA polymerase III sliding clamp (beta) subunit (PCNA family)
VPATITTNANASSEQEHKITFNAKYMYEILNSMPGEDAVINITGKYQPAVIVPYDDSGVGSKYLSIIVPIRIKNNTEEAA